MAERGRRHDDLELIKTQIGAAKLETDRKSVV